MIFFGQDIFSFSRRKTNVVRIGKLPMGGNNPIRVQSMLTPDTMDIKAVVEQSIRLIKVGCKYIRLTTPSIREAEFLKDIKQELINQGYDIPLIADIHYTPNAALEAVRNVEKVRINPGNFIHDKKFNIQVDSFENKKHEISIIRHHLIPLIKLCKENNTALRIGTNHGSLSDRIMRRYGDTPIGMVESAMEYIRICHYEGFEDIVISMKSSNPQVMVYAYRLLVQQLLEEKLPPYPLHLGVTEAGEGEDGRVRSAIGIGALLADGIGDTVRVSLTEAPELEIPVAKKIVHRFENLKQEKYKIRSTISYNPYEYNKQATKLVGKIGGGQVPVVISSIINLVIDSPNELGQNFSDKKSYLANKNAQNPDFINLNDDNDEALKSNIPIILKYNSWKKKKIAQNIYPILTLTQYLELYQHDNDKILAINCCFIELYNTEIKEIDKIKDIFISSTNVIFVLKTRCKNRFQAFRHFILTLKGLSIMNPTLFKITFESDKHTNEDVVLESSCDVGGLLIDGFGDGVWLEWNTYNKSKNNNLTNQQFLLKLSFNILQASRQRITKTEYISCPSCGRTLFDLQRTTAKIRKRTEHLKGLKIGIMGCIVNGPGEMADADYGYVGSGKNQITLYRGKVVVQKAVPTEKSVDALISIIKEDNRWVDP